MALIKFYQTEVLEAGCDEAGRGCLAGPVYAAAVILDKNKQGYEDTLRLELLNINIKISNISKIKHLLLYDENDLSIVDYILNKL